MTQINNEVYAIFGAGKKGKELKSIIDRHCKDQKVKYFLDNNCMLLGMDVCDAIVISPARFKMLYDAGDVKGVIIPGQYSYRLVKTMLEQLKDLDVPQEAIHITPFNVFIKDMRNEITERDVSDIFTNQKDFVQIFNMEFHIVDHCNLNCRACNNFSNIVDKEVFVDIESLRKDLLRIHELVDNVRSIGIMGGEPLLNPNINDYIVMTREIFPYSSIHVCSNGLLVKNMDDTFFDTLRENNVRLDLSIYPAIQKHIDDIMCFLRSKDITVRIHHYAAYMEGGMNLTGESDMYEQSEICTHYCPSVRDGKISRCMRSAYIRIFNEKFGLNLPDDGHLDLHDSNLTGKALFEYLHTPINLCRYCGPHKKFKWCTSAGGAKPEDWVGWQK